MTAVTGDESGISAAETRWAGRLVLGTVQLGLDYGISNTQGQVTMQQAEEILQRAASAGIPMLDTARAYGNSETVLGKVLGTSDLPFDLISKPAPKCMAEELASQLHESLRHLRRSHLYGYLVHSFEDFRQASLRQALYSARDRGEITKVGVSVYFPHEVEWLLDNAIDTDLVQLPFNVFDRRFEPLFSRMHDQGIEIHVRSAFLQGLFFLQPEIVRQRFPGAVQAHAQLHTLCARYDISMNSALLNFVLGTAHVDKLVIGVTCVEELEENLKCSEDFPLDPALREAFAELSLQDERIILPFNWK